MGFELDPHSLLLSMVEVLLVKCFKKQGPGVVDIVYQWVQCVPPFSYSFDPLVDFVSFDICECHGYLPHGGFKSRYSYVDTDVVE